MPVTSGAISAGASVLNNTINGLFQSGVTNAKKSQINAQTNQINQQTADLQLQLEQTFGLQQQSLTNQTNTGNQSNVDSSIAAVLSAKQQSESSSKSVEIIAISVGALLIFGVVIYFVVKK